MVGMMSINGETDANGGITEFKYNAATGERVPTKVEYSDRLMEVLLKGHFPERFRERISVSGQIGLQPIDAFSNLTAGAKREIRAIIMRDLEEQRELSAARLNAIDVAAIESGDAAALSDLRGDTGGDYAE